MKQFWLRFYYWASVMADQSEMPIAADKQRDRIAYCGFKLTDKDTTGDPAFWLAFSVPLLLVGLVGACIFMVMIR